MLVRNLRMLKGIAFTSNRIKKNSEEGEQEEELPIGAIKDEVERAGPRFRQTWAVVSDARHQ